MKIRILIWTVLLVFCSSPAGKAVAATRVRVEKLHTNFNFEDQLVRGKYIYPDEGITTVEDDKLLDDLLDGRKDFKDRVKEASERR